MTLTDIALAAGLAVLPLAFLRYSGWAAWRVRAARRRPVA